MSKNNLRLMGDINAWCYTDHPHVWTVRTFGTSRLELVPTPVIRAVDLLTIIVMQFVAVGLAIGLSLLDQEPKLYLTVSIAISALGWGGLAIYSFALKMISRLPSPILELDLNKQLCKLHGGSQTFRIAEIESILFIQEWVDKLADTKSSSSEYLNLYEVQLLVNDGRETTRHWLLAGKRPACCFAHGEQIADFAGFKKNYISR